MVIAGEKYDSYNVRGYTTSDDLIGQEGFATEKEAKAYLVYLSGLKNIASLVLYGVHEEWAEGVQLNSWIPGE